MNAILLVSQERSMFHGNALQYRFYIPRQVNVILCHVNNNNARYSGNQPNGPFYLNSQSFILVVLLNSNMTECLHVLPLFLMS
jgi:hypothetical protein